MRQVSLGRTFADAHSIYIEQEVVVSAHFDREVSGAGIEVNDLAKMKHPTIARRGCRVRDPLGRPKNTGLLWRYFDLPGQIRLPSQQEEQD